MIPTVSRAISATISPLPLSFVRARPRLHTHLHRPTSCISSISSVPITPDLQTPLFLRPPTCTATLPELQKWQKWAHSLALSVGSKFLESDGGPESDLLCREIKWILEDVVEDYAKLREVIDGDCLEGRKSDLGMFSQVGSDQNCGLVRLRAELDELYTLWKERIEQRRPFQYIVGCQYWRDLVLAVQEGVLIPRPETEMIVDMVEEAISKERQLGEGIWADMGTGSGAIGIGIGRVLGDSGRVIATDVSPVAASVTKLNVERYDLQNKIEVRQGSWFRPLQDVIGKMSGIVSNPPYIPSCKIPGLQAEVGRHEPRLALDGGENGMDDLLFICGELVPALKPGGFFAFETDGDSQSELIADILSSKTKGRFQDVKIVADLGGIRRFVSGFRC